MEDIQGEVTGSENDDAIVVVPELPEELKTEENEWEECVARLEKHCDKTWICWPTPVPWQFRIAELETCSGELFFKWLLHVYPLAKEMKHSASDYDILDHRMKAFYNVVNQLKMLEFPKNPEMQTQKTEEK